LLGIVNSLPLTTAYLWAGKLGLLSYYIFPGDRRTALDNLRLSLAAKSKEDLKAIYRKSLENIGYSVVDVLRFGKLSKDDIRDMVEVSGLEHFDQAYKKSKGVVALTGHISNFELIAAWFGQSGYKSAAVGRKIYDERLNRLLINNRYAMKVLNIDSEAPVKEFLKVLRDGYAVGVLIDQDSRRYRGEFVDFFCKPAYTPIGPILLAWAAKAAVLPLAIIRKSPARYRLTIYPEIAFDYHADREAEIKRVLALATKILEGVIKENPEHWVWMHKRWRTKPGTIEK